MGLFGSMLAGAGEEIGGTVKQIGLTQIESSIREEAAARAREHASTLQEGVAVRSDARRMEDAKQTRADVHSERIERAPDLRKEFIKDAIELQTAKNELDRDPANVEAKAKAATAEKRILAMGEADIMKTLAADPAWLKAKKAMLAAEHPERLASAAASMASIAKSQFELKSAGEVKGARADLAKALKSGTEDDVRSARETLGALEGLAGRAEQGAASTVLNSLGEQVKQAQLNARTESAALLKVKEELAASPEASAAKQAAVAAATARVAENDRRAKTYQAHYDKALAEYQRNWAPRERKAAPERGMISAPAGDHPDGGGPRVREPLSSFGGQ